MKDGPARKALLSAAGTGATMLACWGLTHIHPFLGFSLMVSVLVGVMVYQLEKI